MLYLPFVRKSNFSFVDIRNNIPETGVKVVQQEEINYSLVKNTISCATFFFVLCFCNACFAESPEWLYQIPNQNFEVIGYGIAAELDEAKDHALADIAKQLHVKVNSSMRIEQQLSGDRFNEASSLSLKTRTQAELFGAEVIKSEQIKGTWFVATRYDNTPLLQKIKRELNNQKPLETKRYTSHDLLKNSPLVKQIISMLAFEVPTELIRHNGVWHLNIMDSLFPIQNSDIPGLFFEQQSPNIRFSTNQKTYYEGDKMVFTINTNKEGYISILYVESDGKVGIILDNYQVGVGQYIFPQADSEDQFIVANPMRAQLHELYIAMITSKKINLLKFFNAVNNHYLDGSSYQFDKLLSNIKPDDLSAINVTINF